MNNCDIEEVKFQALQKFIETADTPEKWERPEYNASVYGAISCRLGKFVLGRFYGHNSGHYFLNLSDEWIFNLCLERKPLASPGKGWEEAYEKLRLEFETSPAIIAARKIFAWWDEKEKQERCEEQQKALRETCLKIQGALEDALSPSRKSSGKWWLFWK